MLGNLGLILGIGIPVIVLIILCLVGYVKAPPNKAIIISGLRKEPKILIGRAGIKIPFLDRKDELLIKQISIDIKTNGYVPTLDFIGVNVDAVAKIRLKTDDAGIKVAMKNFLNMKESEISQALTDSLQGNMREIIGTIDLKSLSTEREKFGNQVQEKAQKDMNALGVEIISCNIQKAEDENGLIIALGQDNMAQIQKNASIAKANAERDVAIAEAEAAKAANDAKVASDTEIAVKQNELAIKKAELKKEADIKQAEADAAYKIQEEEQRKVIEATAVNADIAKEERMVELTTKQAATREQELTASIKKKADADKYAEQQKADVELYRRQKDADAKLFEEQKQADAMKAKADADKYAKQQEAEAIKAKGLAEAEAIKAKGLADAEAIKAKGLAEAEAIDKKAEAMKKMGEAAVLEMFFEMYPKAVEAAAKPLGNVDSMVMYGDGNSTKLVQDIVGTTSQISEGIKSSTGLDIQSIISGFVGGKLSMPEKEETDNTTAVKGTSEDKPITPWIEDNIDE